MNEKEWELEVYRNTHNLCVWCGKPAETKVFHDVPVCKEHINGIANKPANKTTIWNKLFHRGKK